MATRKGKSRKRAVDEKLRAMTSDVEKWPIPNRVLSVLDQLDEDAPADADKPPAPIGERKRG